MVVHRIVTDYIPQGIEGQKYADEYEFRMTYYAATVTRQECTVNIILTTDYYIDITEDYYNDSRGN